MKEYQGKHAEFEDTIRDFRDPGFDGAMQMSMTLAIGALLGAELPGAAASVAVAFERLFPEGSSAIRRYVPEK